VVARRWRPLAEQLDDGFDAYEADQGLLPGLTLQRRASLIRQLVDSCRVNSYLEHLRTEPLSQQASDPSDEWFNPVKAAIIHFRRGEDDEAFWLVFLRTHFGKHRGAGWAYSREVYGGSGSGGPWTWQRVTGDLQGFRDWVGAYAAQASGSRLPHGFGNHRKYESLAGTGSVVASYVAWVGDPPEHGRRFGEALAAAGNDPEGAFDVLYRSMNEVRRFGRLARFDYLSLAGKIGLAPVRPGKAYLRDSSGPLKGATLLFGPPGEPGLSVTVLEQRTAALRDRLGVTFDVMEDALCNWQKSPDQFRPFRG
jgi:hypothetical protein